MFKDIKLSLFASNLMVYIENPKGATKKKKKIFPELIREFSKVNIQN